MEDKFIQLKEAARILGVSKLTLRNWDNSGKLSAYRHPINNYRVYKLADVLNLLKLLETRKTPSNVLRKKSKSLFNKSDEAKPKVFNLKVKHLSD